MTMDKKLAYQILQRLKSNKTITSNNLAEQLSTTNFYIRKEIENLNMLLKDDIGKITIKRAKGNGYTLEVYNHEKLEIFMKEQLIFSDGNDHLTIPIQRVSYIALIFLNAKEGIKLNDLAEEVAVSTRQLNNDLKEVRALFADYLLEIVSRPYYGMILKGSEFNKRLCMANLYVQKWVFAGTDGMNRVFLNAEIEHQIEEIRKTIINEIREAQIEIADVTVENLTIHILIMIKRVQQDHSLDNVEEASVLALSPNEIALSKKILTHIATDFEVTFTQADYEYLGLHLAGKRIYLDEDRHLISIEVRRLVDEIIKEIDVIYNTEYFNDDYLKMRLCLHMVPLLIRVKANIISKNPLSKDIKLKYLFSYEMACIAGRIINKKYGVILEENELSYLALHFEISQNQIETKRYRVLLVDHTSKYSSEILKQQIDGNFSKYIEVLDVYPMNKLIEIDLDSYSFIFTTVSIQVFTKTPVYKINNFMDLNDESLLSEVFELGDTADKRIRKYFPKELFLPELTANSKEEVIQQMVRYIAGHIDIPDNFYDEVMEREKIASTDYGNQVALPHPVKLFDERTYTCVAILKKPIKWGENMVRLILLNSIGKTAEDLQPYYYVITKFIVNQKKVKELIDTPEYEYFISLLCSNDNKE